MSVNRESGPEIDTRNALEEVVYGELYFSIPEIIEYARQIGDEALATEFEAYERWHEKYNAQVRVLTPEDASKPVAYELVFLSEQEV